MRHIARLSGAIILTFIAHIPIQAAQLYYVDDVASNGNGSSGSPFNDIQSALAVVQPGDTIYIRPGTYSGIWTSVSNGTAGQRISIDGADKDTTIVSGNQNNGNGGLTIKHSYYSVSRLTFKDHHGHGLKVVGHPDDSNVSTYINSVFVSDCDFLGNGTGGGWSHGLFVKNADDAFINSVYCFGNHTSGCTLSNCKSSRVVFSRFDGNDGTTNSEGLAFMNCRYSSIESCSANYNGESGFDLSVWEGIPADLSNCTIEFCDARENDGEGYAISGTNSGSQLASTFTIKRCFSGHNNGSGIAVYDSAGDVEVTNCTVVENENRGISAFANAYNVVVRNSVFFENYASTDGPFEDAGGDASAYNADYNSWSNLPAWMGALSGANDVSTTSPQFVDPLNGDFELLASSPFIDEGDSIVGVSFLGDSPDLGTYEKQ